MVNKVELDNIFQALSNQTRRQIINDVLNGPCKVTDIKPEIKMSVAAISKHLTVLEKANLIKRYKKGREVWLKVKVNQLESAQEWVDQMAGFWKTNLDRLDLYLTMNEEK
jgi:predicted transcriptional regulator